jgi:hypothetical protein
VRVNELLAHAPPPWEDAVELYNPGPDLADLSGWFLGADPFDPQAYRIPDGTLLLPGRYTVFYARDLRLGLPATGGRLYLASADRSGRPTGLLQGFDYEAAEAGLSIGRLEMAQGPSSARLLAPSFGVDAPPSVEAFRSGSGAPNTAPRLGPVLISEIMYHPAADGGAEFVELQSLASEPIVLHETGRPETAWRFTAGIDFVFPEAAVMPAGGRALLVPIEPELFRTLRALPADLPIFGPYEGRLSNGGETLTLARPFERAEDEGRDPGADAGVFVTVDRVRYSDASPWPEAADGGGPSLERRDPVRHGDEPEAWLALAAGGTPGRANTAPSAIWLPLLSNRR